MIYKSHGLYRLCNNLLSVDFIIMEVINFYIARFSFKTTIVWYYFIINFATSLMALIGIFLIDICGLFYNKLINPVFEFEYQKS